MTHVKSESLHEEIGGLQCPTQVGFAANIAPMFTSTDVSHMKSVTSGSLDLHNYNNVKIWAGPIYKKVASGAMPPPGTGEPKWTPQMVNTFGCWIQQGCKP